jgi:hypothetical protein
MLRTSLPAAGLALVLAAPASAQDRAAPPEPAAAKQIFLARQTPNEWRGTKLIGAAVYGPEEHAIGQIDELVVDEQGQVRAVVIGVGGFLGIGEKKVAVPFQALTMQRKPNTSSLARITVGVTKKDLQQAPKFVYLKANGANNTTAGAPPRR